LTRMQPRRALTHSAMFDADLDTLRLHHFKSAEDILLNNMPSWHANNDDQSKIRTYSYGTFDHLRHG
jgi:hypothetical protein